MIFGNTGYHEWWLPVDLSFNFELLTCSWKEPTILTLLMTLNNLKHKYWPSESRPIGREAGYFVYLENLLFEEITHLVMLYYDMLYYGTDFEHSPSKRDFRTEIGWNSATISRAHDYLSNVKWAILYDITNPPLTIWNNFCSILNRCINISAHVVRIPVPSRRSVTIRILSVFFLSKPSSGENFVM